MSYKLKTSLESVAHLLPAASIRPLMDIATKSVRADLVQPLLDLIAALEQKPRDAQEVNLMNWYDDYANVKALGAWLVHHFTELAQLQEYYEKPWNWSREWEQFQAKHIAELDDACEHCGCDWCEKTLLGRS